MSLRKEILSKTLRGGNKVKTPEQVVDEILKLFEKRIDSVNDLDDAIKNGGYSGDEEFWAGYQLGFDKAIELIKKLI
jgi:hypothetical protein